ncbi:unnamed protein product [Parnassius mnemosyne]|uniref:RING-CH-type domain-containing protein n=1 Tax=Parnassius mnemosyne TaxID=213953 RepID=A0AAV1LZL0_9NEOP
MPHPRRRKFSVKNNIITNDIAQLQNANNSDIKKDVKPTTNCISNLVDCDKQTLPNTTICTDDRKNIKDNSSTLLTTTKGNLITTNKDISVTLSINDLISANTSITFYKKSLVKEKENTMKIQTQSDIQKTAIKRSRHARQHIIKIRNPKRRTPLTSSRTTIVTKLSIGTDTEGLTTIPNTLYIEKITDNYNNEEISNSYSIEDMCRICHGGDTFSQELGNLISACSCRGTVGRVHIRCLERWLTESGKSRCELCGIRYVTRRVHRYGVPKGLVMWILSQNAKQLMVDTLGIILMSPLAIMAAWLSGRTFTGLISQETHSSATPWPLASTFVLACMTLVCYYCWIVSAATRHALSWWIWYRSQYEVRLELHSETEQ